MSVSQFSSALRRAIRKKENGQSGMMHPGRRVPDSRDMKTRQSFRDQSVLFARHNPFPSSTEPAIPMTSVGQWTAQLIELRPTRRASPIDQTDKSYNIQPAEAITWYRLRNWYKNAFCGASELQDWGVGIQLRAADMPHAYGDSRVVRCRSSKTL